MNRDTVAPVAGVGKSRRAICRRAGMGCPRGLGKTMGVVEVSVAGTAE